MNTKLILLACICFSLASCEKETVQPTRTPSTASMDRQVADLIRRADKNLYDTYYDQDLMKASRSNDPMQVKVTSGAFVAQDKDITSGTCFPANTICFIEIVVGAAVKSDPLQNGARISINPMETDFTRSYLPAEDAKIIINTPEPVTKDISKLNVFTSEDGLAHVSYKVKQ